MMLGIILCGGQSSRMGSDKGLLNYQHKLWAQLAVDKLTGLNLPVRLSINPVQKDSYINYFAEELLLVDQAAVATKGPLLGVLSAHQSFPSQDLFLLACDLLLITEKLLKRLVTVYQTSKGFDVYIFTRNNQQEPLCGIYKAEALQRILSLLQNEGITKPSMKFILSQLNVFEIALEGADEHLFNNFNFPSEISDL